MLDPVWEGTGSMLSLVPETSSTKLKQHISGGRFQNKSVRLDKAVAHTDIE